MYIINMNTYLSDLPDEISRLVYKFIFPLYEIQNIGLIYNNIVDIEDHILLSSQYKLINELLIIYNININTMTTKQIDFMKNLINNFDYNQSNDFYLHITNINIINTIKNIIGDFNTNKMYIPEENYMLYDITINEFNFFE